MVKQYEDVVAALDQLETRVSNIEDVQASAKEYVEGIKTQLQNATSAPASGGRDDYQALVDRINRLTERIDADAAAEAIVSGTSAATEPDSQAGEQPA